MLDKTNAKQVAQHDEYENDRVADKENHFHRIACDFGKRQKRKEGGKAHDHKIQAKLERAFFRDGAFQNASVHAEFLQNGVWSDVLERVVVLLDK